jgi:hypothetical protein
VAAVAGYRTRGAHLLPNALGQLARTGAVRPLQHQRKLLAPIASHDVDLAHAGFQVRETG